MIAEYYMALDVGTKRIGVAVAHYVARLPRPLTTLTASEQNITEITSLIADEGVRALVVGLPRNLDGTDSEQTRYSQAFAEQLLSAVTIPVHTVDETLTSVQAEAELKRRGIQTYDKGTVDALAACYILERFLEEQPTAVQEQR